MTTELVHTHSLCRTQAPSRSGYRFDDAGRRTGPADIVCRMSTFEGGNGQISFDGSTVTITREGGLGSFSELPTVTIPVTDVVDVLVHDPVAILKGWVYVATTGHESMPSAVEVGKNANTVTFGKKQAAAAQALCDEVRSAIGKG